MNTNLETLLFGLFSALIGATIAYFADFRKSRRERKEARRALEASIAAEIYCNIELVIERIGSIWSALDDGAEHIPAFSMQVHSSVFESAQQNLGLLDPETAAQIIFLYARIEDLLKQHDLLASYAGETDGGYATHRLFLHKSLSETEKDALELIRILNGRGIGEYLVDFDLSPEKQRLKTGRALRAEAVYRANTPFHTRLLNSLKWKIQGLFQKR